MFTELCYWFIIPDVGRGLIGIGTWALFLLPVLLLGFVQTSSEELLFRGYLQRGLAYRFSSLAGLGAAADRWSSRRCTGIRRPCSA